MSKNNNTTNMVKKQYRHLKKEDRIKIESLINVNVNINLYKKWNISVYKKWNISDTYI